VSFQETKDVKPSQLKYECRLIVATNRGPVEHYLSQDNSLRQRRGAGGVVTALIDAGNYIEMTWVALAITEGDRIALKKIKPQERLFQSPICSQKTWLHYVTISKSAFRKHYEVISNQVLWFLHHYLYIPPEDQDTIKRIQDAWTNGYYVANQAIAEAVHIEIAREETPAVLMLHDRQLYLVPAMIRKYYPSLVIQQFIHTPWPDIRCWYFLPDNIIQDIHRSLVCNDIIGFQTEHDAHNFLQGIDTLLHDAIVDFEHHEIWWQEHRTQVCVYPISISVKEELCIVQSNYGKRASEKIIPYLNQKIIMRVDRIDPTKNILRGFQAYDLMPEEHPALLNQVVFLAFLVPSREAMPEYKHYKKKILKIVKNINRKYGSKVWKPIVAFYGDDREMALAAMQFYDVLLVNPIIDGMNLVAKEGPIVNQRDGVLVLSYTAGAFQQLRYASLPISPIDTIETAQALYDALTLTPEERHIKSTLARQTVLDYDLNSWLKQQFDDINNLLTHLSLYLSNPRHIIQTPTAITDEKNL
jgi:trehalose 6-phosphate synthase